MDLIRGGDLWNYMEAPFSEDMARFYIVQIAMALGYLHERNIIHRDLKSENIMVKEDGYLCLIDFGTAQKVKDKQERRMTLAGTDGCQAPEMLKQVGHSFAVDWWALGILTYEMIATVKPFYDDEETVSGKIIFPPLSSECEDFITKLLVKDPESRLGTSGGSVQVLAHPWLQGIDQDEIIGKVMEPPIRPEVNSAQ